MTYSDPQIAELLECAKKYKSLLVSHLAAALAERQKLIQLLPTTEDGARVAPDSFVFVIDDSREPPTIEETEYSNWEANYGHETKCWSTYEGAESELAKMKGDGK